MVVPGLVRGGLAALSLVLFAPLLALASPPAVGGASTGGAADVTSPSWPRVSTADVYACLRDQGRTPLDPFTLRQGCRTYIVVLKHRVGNPRKVAEEHTAMHGGTVGFVYRTAFKGYAATLPAAKVDLLRADPRVAWIEADQKVEALDQETPTGIRRIFADNNAALAIDAKDDVRVDADIAIIDTGVDYDHPDLNLVARTDCTLGDPFGKKSECLDDAGDDAYGHGTHVAGTAAALDNGVGVVGAAPGARVWSVRVLGADGSGSMSQVIAGIDWVTTHADEIDVANMSLGCRCQSAAEDKAIATSVAKGVVYAVAAGNSSTDASHFSPASHPDVITVSALADFDGEPGGRGAPTCRSDEDDTLAQFSNYGPLVDVVAPGVCITSTWKGGGYETISGTSMASPHVAGAAALLTSMSDPTDKAGVERIRRTIIAEGNFDWVDDPAPPTCDPRCPGSRSSKEGSSAEDGDGLKEPLLDVSDAATFSPAVAGGPFNMLPKARFTQTCNAKMTCTFDASGSSDGDGSIASYAWTFGDRGRSPATRGATVSHTFKTADTYTVLLTVRDDRGAVGRQAALVTVSNGRTGIPLARPRCGAPGDDKCESWIATYDNANGLGRSGNGWDSAYAVAASPSGERVYVTGFSWDNTTESLDYATVAYDAASGNQIWLARYSGPAEIDDAAYAIAVSPDGSRVYVTGVQDVCFTCAEEEFASERFDIGTVAYDAATGKQLWALASGSADEFNGPSSIATGPDGRHVYVAGGRCYGYRECEYTTIAYRAGTGAKVWSSRYAGPWGGVNSARSMEVSRDGSRVYVTGSSPGAKGLGDRDYLTVAYGAATGTQLWASRYAGLQGSQGSQDDVASVAVSGDGSRVYVTGASEALLPEFGLNHWDFATIAYDAASGAQLWVTRYDRAGGYDGATGVAVSPKGDRVYVTGDTADGEDTGAGEQGAAATIAYEAKTGAPAWTSLYGLGTSHIETARAVRTSPDGSFVYVGASVFRSDGGFDYATLAYNTGTGSKAWVARYNSSPVGSDPDGSRPAPLGNEGGMAVTADGRRIYLTGSFLDYDDAANCCQYGTVAYDAARR